ncbi:MAG: hypothetical protein HYR63_13175 [Proteobacteria bacterium]|nr:hypothetical protein [Pseudomonadota bacterium]MBI3496952.1 hypothetical protein [Pseudomonadota bacterium]
MAVKGEGTQFEAVADTAVDGVILIDALGAVSIFNPACERTPRGGHGGAD